LPTIFGLCLVTKVFLIFGIVTYFWITPMILHSSKGGSKLEHSRRRQGANFPRPGVT